ncbi:MAG: glutamate synthase subunit beta [Bacteroidia bacterium]
MGKTTGFIEFDRQTETKEAPKERIKHYNEIYNPSTSETINSQAARCMDCGIPFCHSGCPLGNRIPDFNDAVYNDQWEKAYGILKSTNNFPEFTGRICPAPCEGSCVLGINNDAVAIEFIEKNIAEKAFEEGYEKVNIPENRTGKKVAIIGSGPAGLAVADQLNQLGHNVDVFERDKMPGGLLRFGIPDFKLEKWVVERRVEKLKAEGISFKCGITVGNDISFNEIDKNYNAIVLCTGSTTPREIGVKGRELKGIHFAMEFLGQSNKLISGINYNEETISAKNKNVVVIGGGDTGSDCVGTSNRQGAKSVTQIEILDQPPIDRNEANPWPEWPLILRTSTSHEEGCERQWSLLTKEFVGKKGAVSGLKVVDVSFENGKMIEKENSEREIPCDLVLIAAGFVGQEKDGLAHQIDVEVNERNNIDAFGFSTKLNKVFAAGDARIGQSLVVSAIAEGRKAAIAVDRFLNS